MLHPASPAASAPLDPLELATQRIVGLVLDGNIATKTKEVESVLKAVATVPTVGIALVVSTVKKQLIGMGYKDTKYEVILERVATQIKMPDAKVNVVAETKSPGSIKTTIIRYLCEGQPDAALALYKSLPASAEKVILLQEIQELFAGFASEPGEIKAGPGRPLTAPAPATGSAAPIVTPAPATAPESAATPPSTPLQKVLDRIESEAKSADFVSKEVISAAELIQNEWRNIIKPLSAMAARLQAAFMGKIDVMVLLEPLYKAILTHLFEVVQIDAKDEDIAKEIERLLPDVQILIPLILPLLRDHISICIRHIAMKNMHAAKANAPTMPTNIQDHLQAASLLLKSWQVAIDDYDKKEEFKWEEQLRTVSLSGKPTNLRAILELNYLKPEQSKRGFKKGFILIIEILIHTQPEAACFLYKILNSKYPHSELLKAMLMRLTHAANVSIAKQNQAKSYDMTMMLLDVLNSDLPKDKFEELLFILMGINPQVVESFLLIYRIRVSDPIVLNIFDKVMRTAPPVKLPAGAEQQEATLGTSLPPLSEAQTLAQRSLIDAILTRDDKLTERLFTDIFNRSPREAALIIQHIQQLDFVVELPLSIIERCKNSSSDSNSDLTAFQSAITNMEHVIEQLQALYGEQSIVLSTLKEVVTQCSAALQDQKPFTVKDIVSITKFKFTVKDVDKHATELKYWQHFREHFTAARTCVDFICGDLHSSLALAFIQIETMILEPLNLLERVKTAGSAAAPREVAPTAELKASAAAPKLEPAVLPRSTSRTAITPASAAEGLSQFSINPAPMASAPTTTEHSSPKKESTDAAAALATAPPSLI